MMLSGGQIFTAPPRYDSTEDHFHNFFEAIRTRRPVVEDAVFGMRAAGPAICDQCHEPMCPSGS